MRDNFQPKPQEEPPRLAHPYHEIFTQEDKKLGSEVMLKKIASTAMGERDFDIAEHVKKMHAAREKGEEHHLGNVEVERVVPDHDLLHMERVLSNGGKIIDSDFSKDEEVRRIVNAILILHDIITHPKNSPGYATEAGDTADYAQNLLEMCDYEDKDIKLILLGIRQISYLRDETPEVPEAQIAFDSDKMDQFGLIGIFRYSSTSGHLGRPHFHETDPLNKTGRTFSANENTVDSRLLRIPKIREMMFTHTGKQVADRRSRYEGQYFYPELELEIEENKGHEGLAWTQESGAILVLNVLRQAGKERKSFYEPTDPFAEHGRTLDPSQYPLDRIIAVSRNGIHENMPPDIAARRKKFLLGALEELKLELSGE